MMATLAAFVLRLAAEAAWGPGSYHLRRPSARYAARCARHALVEAADALGAVQFESVSGAT